MISRLCGALAAVAYATTASAAPIAVVPMVHADPIPTSAALPDATITDAWREHAAGIRWYMALADRYGFGISLQATGPVLEASVRTGDVDLWRSFMPDGPHTLGVHQHNHYKTSRTRPLRWALGPSTAADLTLVAEMFGDQVWWANEVFRLHGFGPEDVYVHHGCAFETADRYEPDNVMHPALIENDGSVATSYPNVFTVCEGVRGVPWAWRGPCFADPPVGDAAASAVRFPSVGGIAGEDEVHGPEGLVHGSLAYLQADFLRVYVQWREWERRGLEPPVMHFDFMTHPYQLVEGYVGSAEDGRSPRATIEAFVAWVDAEFIGAADPTTGATIAEWATILDVHDAYLAAEAADPGYSARLAAAVDDGSYLRYVPAIDRRLPAYKYVGRATALTDRYATIEAFQLARASDAPTSMPARATLLWSEAGTTRVSLGRGRFTVLYGDGRTATVRAGGTLAVGAEPVLVWPS